MTDISEDEELRQIDARQREIRKERETLHDRRQILEEKKRLNRQPASISDHALVRYLERVCGVNIDALRRQILTPDRVAAIEQGATSIRAGGCRMVIKDKTIVTVLE